MRQGLAPTVRTNPPSSGGLSRLPAMSMSRVTLQSFSSLGGTLTGPGVLINLDQPAPTSSHALTSSHHQCAAAFHSDCSQCGVSQFQPPKGCFHEILQTVQFGFVSPPWILPLGRPAAHHPQEQTSSVSLWVRMRQYYHMLLFGFQKEYLWLAVQLLLN